MKIRREIFFIWRIIVSCVFVYSWKLRGFFLFIILSTLLFDLFFFCLLICFFCRSPNHATNNGRSMESRTMPPCKPPPSRPPPTIDELTIVGNGNTNTSNNNSNINNNIANVNTNNGTPINVPKSHSSHNVATPTGRQPKSVRILTKYIFIVLFLGINIFHSPKKFFSFKEFFYFFLLLLLFTSKLNYSLE